MRGAAMRKAFQTSLGALLLTTSAVGANPDAGRDVFRQYCIGCHSIECNRSGPQLRGLLGRTAGTVPDFDGYSEAMKNSGIVWNEDTLDAFLKDPVSIVPKNAMSTFRGLPDDSARQNLIEFLSQPDTSLDLCF
jgi:cytochrome c